MANNDVATKHDQYSEQEDAWKEMRDHLKGSRAIKKAGVKYLPMLGDPTSRSDRMDYEAYKMRALYYEAAKRTKQAMVGALFMKPPEFTELDDKYREQFKQVTLDGYSMDTFLRNVASEVVSVARCGVLVERAREDDGGHMYFVHYKAEEIVNWRFERIEDKILLTLVVLKESYTEADGRFDSQERTRYRVLELTDGVYTQSVFNVSLGEKGEMRYVESEEVVPVNTGEPLSEIPFVFFTPMGNIPEVQESPLSSIAEINASHYRTSADLEHGRHFTGLPTAWVAGFDTESELKIGSQTAWVSDNVSARAGFLEFTGSGLSTLQVALQEKQEQMATMGARMLRPPKTGVEAAETARIYQAGESGTLGDLALAIGESMNALMEYWLRWQGEEEPEVSVEMNTDYVDSRIDSSTLTALLNTWMAGGISYETFFYNLQHGEMVPDGRTADDERDLIDQGGGPPGMTEPDDSGAE